MIYVKFQSNRRIIIEIIFLENEAARNKNLFHHFDLLPSHRIMYGKNDFAKSENLVGYRSKNNFVELHRLTNFDFFLFTNLTRKKQ